MVQQFVIIFLISSVLFSQEISIHKLHKEEFGLKFKKESLFDKSGKDIIPLQKNNKLKKSVFGYLPDWEYISGRSNLKYDLLTHIAAFDFSVDKNGNVANPSYWPWTDVINTAHQNGVKIILCAVNFTQSEISVILKTDSIKQNLFKNLKSKILQYKLDGVNIDFEDLKTADRGSLFNGFMLELKNFIKSVDPNLEVSFAGPAVNWGGWDFAGLVNSCDYVFIMGYNFYGSWSSTTGASAPHSGGNYNISNTVNTQYGLLPDSLCKKLILGLPYYGCKWVAKNQNSHAPVLSYVSSTRFRTDFALANQNGKLWDESNKVPWYRWQISDTSWGQVWFDNDTSLGLKYSLAENKNFKGVGMWALNYDGSLPQLWDELRRRYFITNIKNKNSRLLNGFYLSQNFPNPFNGATRINYSLPTSGLVKLIVFDLLGREKYIFSKNQIAGNYFFDLDFAANNFSSGLYFYKITFNNKNINYTETKKLVYLK